MITILFWKMSVSASPFQHICATKVWNILLKNFNFGYLIEKFFFAVFIVADLAKSKQKILSQYNIDIGNLPPKDGKKITFNVLSLMEGTIELSKSVRYQITNTTNVTAAERCEPLPTNDGSTITAQPVSQPSRKSHSINIEYVDGMVVKSKKETIVIPCTAEFLFTGKLYTLSKEPLQKAYKNEDFLYRVELEIKSVDIEILDMFLISVSDSNRRFQCFNWKFVNFFSYFNTLRITTLPKNPMERNVNNTAKRIRKGKKCATFVCSMPKRQRTIG